MHLFDYHSPGFGGWPWIGQRRGTACADTLAAPAVRYG